jgi:hypothetical protein
MGSAQRGELDVAAFRSWLELHCNEPVGTPYNDCFCPLARWLAEREGKECSVTGYSYSFLHAGEWLGEYDLPEWATAFMVEFDTVFAEGQAVTGMGC